LKVAKAQRRFWRNRFRSFEHVNVLTPIAPRYSNAWGQRVRSGGIAKRVKDNPTLGRVHPSGVIALQGALPINVGHEVVGVSGSPGGDKDEACAKAGLDRVDDQLK
jgi:uncharacterized protein GlcG (DUF336 family)